MKVLGAFAFSVSGIHAALAVPLAQANISVLAIATYDTDHILVKEENLERAMQVLIRVVHHSKTAAQTDFSFHKLHS